MDIQEVFSQYRDFYAAQHPASVPRPEMYEDMSDTPSWLPKATAAMFVSASLLSGVHTVSTVYRLMEVSNALLPSWVYIAVALFSFVSVELALLLSAYLIVRERWWGYAILVVVFLFAMTANLDSVSRALGANGRAATFGEIAVAVIMGIGAPLMALMAGKVYVQINRSERALAKRNKDNYQTALERFDAEVIKAFNKAYPNAKSSISVSVPMLSNKVNSLNSANEQSASAVHSVNSLNGYTKQMNSRQIIGEYFERHPEFKNMTLDQLNEAIEQESGIRVGRTSIHNVRKEWVVPASSNGHSTLQ